MDARGTGRRRRGDAPRCGAGRRSEAFVKRRARPLRAKRGHAPFAAGEARRNPTEMRRKNCPEKLRIGRARAPGERPRDYGFFEAAAASSLRPYLAVSVALPSALALTMKPTSDAVAPIGTSSLSTFSA